MIILFIISLAPVVHVGRAPLYSPDVRLNLLSVRKVVLTLTTRSAEIYLSMAGAKQLVTLGFIPVPDGTVRPTGVCSGHYIALHCGACRGGLQVRRERRLVLQVLIEASANIVVKAESMQVSAVCRPPRLGDCPSFYRPRRSQFTSCHAILSTCGGIAYSATE
jgi:hypothetical protein